MAKSKKPIISDYDIANEVIRRVSGMSDNLSGFNRLSSFDNYTPAVELTPQYQDYQARFHTNVINSAIENNMVYDEDMNPIPFTGEGSRFPYISGGGYRDTGRLPSIVSDFINPDGTRMSEDLYNEMIAADPNMDPNEAMALAKDVAAINSKKLFEEGESMVFGNIPILNTLMRAGTNQNFDFKQLITVYDEKTDSYVAKIPTDEELKAVGGTRDVYGPGDPDEEFASKFLRNFSNALAGTRAGLYTASGVVGDVLSKTAKNTIDLLGISKSASDWIEENNKAAQEQVKQIREAYQKSMESGFAPYEEDQFSSDWWASSLGQGAASLAQYGLLGRLTGGSRAGMFSAGMILNGGEAYEAADEAGLSDSEKNTMFLAVGAINTLVELGVGSNKFQKWLVGHNGAKELPKIILEEVGQDVTKLNTKVVRETLAGKIMDVVQKTNNIPILGSALEEGTEEFIQTLVGKTAEAFYNVTAGRGKKPGEGRYEDVDAEETFKEAFGAAAIGAVLGGGGGVGMLIRKQEEINSIMPYIAQGRADVVKGQLAELLSKGEIDEATFNNYNERIDQLDNLWNNNKEAFNNLSKNKDIDVESVKSTALTLIDTEFAIKQSIDKLNKELAENNANTEISDSVKKSNSEKILKKIEAANRRLNSIREDIADHIPDDNGEIKVVKKQTNNKEALDQVRKHVNKVLETELTDEQFDMLANEFPSEGNNVADTIREIQEEGLTKELSEKLKEELDKIDFNKTIEGINEAIEKERQRQKEAEEARKKKEAKERADARKSKKQREKERLEREAEEKEKARKALEDNSKALKKELEEEDKKYKENVSEQAKKHAEENNITPEEVNDIEGTGADGSVTKKDVQDYIDKKKPKKEPEEEDDSKEKQPDEISHLEYLETKKKSLEETIYKLEEEDSPLSSMLLNKLKDELAEVNAKIDVLKEKPEEDKKTKKPEEVIDETKDDEKTKDDSKEEEDDIKPITKDEADSVVKKALDVVNKALEDGREAVLSDNQKIYNFMKKQFMRVSDFIGTAINFRAVINAEYIRNSQPVGQVVDIFGKMFFQEEDFTLAKYQEELKNHRMSDQFSNMDIPSIYNKLIEIFTPVKNALYEAHGQGAIFVTGDLFVYKEDEGLEPGYDGVAGNMDMVVIDEAGDIHIYDFKTRSSREEYVTIETLTSSGKADSYAKQLSAYANLLSGKFDGNITINALVVPVMYELDKFTGDRKKLMNRETRDEELSKYKPAPTDVEVTGDVVLLQMDKKQDLSIRSLLTLQRQPKREILSNKLSAEEEAIRKANRLAEQQRKLEERKKDGLVVNPENHHRPVIDISFKRNSANVITSLNIAYDVIIEDDGESGEGVVYKKDAYVNGRLKIIDNFDSRLQDPNQFNVGTVVKVVIPTIKQLKEKGYNISKEEYDRQMKDPAVFPIAFVDSNNKIIGYVPTNRSVLRNTSNPEVEAKRNMDLRNKIFNNKEANMSARIISKSTGTPMFQENKQSIYDALGDGTRLADNVSIGIFKEGMLQVSQGEVEFDGKIELPEGVPVEEYYQEGVVYAIVPNAKGTHFALPMDINRVSEAKADVIIKLLQLYKANEKFETDKDLIKERDRILDEYFVDLSNYKEVSKIIEQILFIDNSNADHVFSFALNLFVFGPEASDNMSWSEFRSKKGAKEVVKSMITNKYFSVKLSDLNKTFEDWTIEDGKLVMTPLENYTDYLNKHNVLVTNIQSEPVQGTNNTRYFTAQSTIEFDDVTIENTAEPVKEEAEVVQDAEIVEEVEEEIKPQDVDVQAENRLDIDLDFSEAPLDAFSIIRAPSISSFGLNNSDIIKQEAEDLIKRCK